MWATDHLNTFKLIFLVDWGFWKQSDTRKTDLLIWFGVHISKMLHIRQTEQA